LDVILDIRAGSPTYGQYVSVELSSLNHKMTYIPSGFAHGFLSLAENSCVTYLQTTMHAPKHDQGIKFDSFGMSWGVETPIMSKRDLSFPSLVQFKTPFIYKQ
jgi:dTDP-4-dehydrorhamnose 3,5-epimerase-like enzyme